MLQLCNTHRVKPTTKAQQGYHWQSLEDVLIYSICAEAINLPGDSLYPQFKVH